MKRIIAAIIMIMFLFSSTAWAEDYHSLDDILTSLPYLSDEELEDLLEMTRIEKEDRAASETDYGDDWFEEESIGEVFKHYEDALIGSWSPDINEQQPIIVEFYYDDKGDLCHYYYMWNAIEFSVGYAYVQLASDTCECHDVYDGGLVDPDIHVEFLINEIDYGYIYEPTGNRIFYKVSDTRLSVQN